jgi:predicted CXXCH cytochrome family protein
MRDARARRSLVAAGLLGIVLYECRPGTVAEAPTTRTLDLAAWGSDHVGKPVPEYVAGDECLFCHRNDVGPSWNDNRHNGSVRELAPDSEALAALKENPALKGLADAISLVMGETHRQRFLKPSAAYGQLDLFSVAWVPPQPGSAGKLLDAAFPFWDSKTYGESCAGCHSTAVDPVERVFAARSLDCCVCHGSVANEHTKNAALVYLSPRRKDPARVTISVCAQCHVRTGTARSTGRPYPSNFVAGDNLFRDFQVDFSADAIDLLDPGDRHVVQNVRDVVVLGKERVTCLSCHDVHKQSNRKHRLLAQTESCFTCHDEAGLKHERKPYAVHSKVCGY